MSMTSNLSLALRRRGESTLYLVPPSASGADSPLTRYHPAPSRNEVAIVQPVLVKHLPGDMLTHVAFVPRGLLTAARTGHVKFWIRPLVQPRHLRASAYRSASFAD